MDSKKFLISVVIPNFNGVKLLEENLPLVLKAQKDPANKIGEIVVVDDGSTDASISLIKSKYPEVKLIKHTKNRGFSAAVNTGVRAAKGELILLLNSDVSPEADSLIPVFKHFSDPKVFAVSLHEKGYGWAKAHFIDGYIELGMGKESESAHLSFYASGGSGVFRRNYWVNLGGMDEKLLSPFYWEDIDICYRAAKRGYINIWEHEAKVTHNHESTIENLPKSNVQKIRERNQLLFIWKNIGSTSLIRKHIIGLLKRIFNHPGYLRVVLMALMRIGIVLKARRREIRESKVSDEAIFSRFV